MQVFKELINAAEDVWRLEKYRHDYGHSYWVIGPDGRGLPFNEAMHQALARLEKALENAGGAIYLYELQ